MGSYCQNDLPHFLLPVNSYCETQQLEHRVQIPGLLLISYVTLGKFANLSMSWSSLLQNEENTTTYLIELLWGWNELIYKDLE